MILTGSQWGTVGVNLDFKVGRRFGVVAIECESLGYGDAGSYGGDDRFAGEDAEC